MSGLCTTLAVVLSALLPFGQTRTDAAAVTLRSLPGVEVLIEDFLPDVERIVSRNQIQTDVELRLRANHVPVLTRSESAGTLGSPYLYVRVWAAPGPAAFAWAVDVSLVQQVALTRDASVRIYAPTWESRGLLSVSASGDLRRQVRDAVPRQRRPIRERILGRRRESRR